MQPTGHIGGCFEALSGRTSAETKRASSMDNGLLLIIASVLVAFLGFLFSIYTHFSTRKAAGLLYEVSQLSDYGVPESFLNDLPRALVVIRIESAGNKSAENVILRVVLRSKITDHEIEPAGISADVSDNTVIVSLPTLNPTQRFRLLLYCDGRAVDDQVDNLELTHSEGRGLNRRSSSFTTIDFTFLGVDVAYDLLSRSATRIRLGPLRLR
jgi:hypothetical protein